MCVARALVIWLDLVLGQTRKRWLNVWNPRALFLQVGEQLMLLLSVLLLVRNQVDGVCLQFYRKVWALQFIWSWLFRLFIRLICLSRCLSTASLLLTAVFHSALAWQKFVA